jgi:hypothetical protein
LPCTKNLIRSATGHNAVRALGLSAHRVDAAKAHDIDQQDAQQRETAQGIECNDAFSAGPWFDSDLGCSRIVYVHGSPAAECEAESQLREKAVSVKTVKR